MGLRSDRSGVRIPRPASPSRASIAVLVAFVIGGLAGCSSSNQSAPATSSDTKATGAPPSTTTPSIESTTIAPTTATPMTAPSTTGPTTTGPGSLTLRCDADSGESPIFEVPLGTSVTLVATSSIEREYHLHGYDIELTGEEVTFQFTADLPGPHELTEHPDHSTVCTVVS